MAAKQPWSFNPNTAIGIFIGLLVTAFGTFISVKLTHSQDKADERDKIVAEVPNKIQSIKEEIGHHNELVNVKIDGVTKDVARLQVDVTEGKNDLKELGTSQSKLITRDELNAKINIIQAIKEKK